MKILVLFNGGLKDAFLADLARREGKVLACFFILNDKDSNRIRLVERLAVALQIELLVIDLRKAPPLEEILLRMLYLIMHALPIAKEYQCHCIYYGLSIDDDRRLSKILDAYMKQLRPLIELAQPMYDGKGIWLGQVEVETPLRRLDRPRVIRLGNEWNLPWELSFSCVNRTTIHCGTCQACLRRQRAFKQEGHIDPTAYWRDDNVL
ncbi:hypothetical protein LCGC14_0612980 [marine sediment metagenome]|uniref:7-cyano-7-deazaguanine synthase n=1 Tax=marine sediment metagenome TaxID=412755 RepID=A0A0F9TTD9_9ZZZZ